METNDGFVYGVIYKWTNKINGKAYIGKTIDEDRRKYQHIYYKEKLDDYFHRALVKYGVDNFKYEVLIRVHCPVEFADEILSDTEKIYIKKYQTFGEMATI